MKIDLIHLRLEFTLLSPHNLHSRIHNISLRGSQPHDNTLIQGDQLARQVPTLSLFLQPPPNNPLILLLPSLEDGLSAGRLFLAIGQLEGQARDGLLEAVYYSFVLLEGQVQVFVAGGGRRLGALGGLA
jgi:hypothetical protein